MFFVMFRLLNTTFKWLAYQQKGAIDVQRAECFNGRMKKYIYIMVTASPKTQLGQIKIQFHHRITN